MSKYQRPWWLVVNKSPGLATTVSEESKPGERVFIIRGEPLVQGLTWLTWGPVGALAVIFILTWLAIALNVKEQTWTVRGFFIIAYLALPALAWGMMGLVFSRLAEKYVQAERQAETEECIIRLRQKQGELFFQTAPQGTEEKMAYDDIRQVRVAPAIGAREAKALRLLLETNEGTIILLGEALGTPTQKNDLAAELQRALKFAE